MISFWFDSVETANNRLNEYNDNGSKYGEGRVVPCDYGMGGAHFQYAFGLVVDMGENNYYDDSDFYAMVYCPQTNTFDKVIYATTRGWSYNNGCTVDADDDLINACRFRIEKTHAINHTKAYIRKILTICSTPTKGATVTVTKGRKSRGVVGEVFWTGYSAKGFSKLGIRDANDEVHWVWSNNVTVDIRNHKMVRDLRHDYSEGTKYMTASEINDFIDNEINHLES